jgi:hypothetical protein
MEISPQVMGWRAESGLPIDEGAPGDDCHAAPRLRRAIISRTAVGKRWPASHSHAANTAGGVINFATPVALPERANRIRLGGRHELAFQFTLSFQPLPFAPICLRELKVNNKRSVIAAGILEILWRSGVGIVELYELLDLLAFWADAIQNNSQDGVRAATEPFPESKSQLVEWILKRRSSPLCSSVIIIREGKKGNLSVSFFFSFFSLKMMTSFFGRRSCGVRGACGAGWGAGYAGWVVVRCGVL